MNEEDLKASPEYQAFSKNSEACARAILELLTRLNVSPDVALAGCSQALSTIIAVGGRDEGEVRQVAQAATVGLGDLALAQYRAMPKKPKPH